MYKNIELKYGSIVLGNGRTLLITTFDRDKKRANIMSNAWNIIIDKDPFLAGFIIDDYNYTYELIKKEKEFVVNIPHYKMINMVINSGKISGRNCDKFIEYGIDAMESETLIPPSIYGSLAHLEFKFEREIKINKSSMIVGRCIGIRVVENSFIDGEWNYKDDNVKFLHHVNEDSFTISQGYN